MMWPCHSKPKSEWCDRHGPGGFMGHTCKTTARIVAQARLHDASRELRRAEDALADASIKFNKAVHDMDALEPAD